MLQHEFEFQCVKMQYLKQMQTEILGSANYIKQFIYIAVAHAFSICQKNKIILLILSFVIEKCLYVFCSQGLSHYA